MSRGRPAVTTQLGPGRIKRKCVVTRWQKGKGGGSRTMATRCCHRWLRGFVVMCSCQSGQCLLVVVEHYKPYRHSHSRASSSSICAHYTPCSSHRSPVLYQLASLRQARFQLYEYDQFRVFVTTPTSIYSFNIRLLHCTNHPSNDPFVSQHNLHRICSRPSSDR